jgi:hypothetical protein
VAATRHHQPTTPWSTVTPSLWAGLGYGTRVHTPGSWFG